MESSQLVRVPPRAYMRSVFPRTDESAGGSPAMNFASVAPTYHFTPMSIGNRGFVMRADRWARLYITVPDEWTSALPLEGSLSTICEPRMVAFLVVSS